MLRLSLDMPIEPGGGNLSTQLKPPPNQKSLATFSHAVGEVQTQTVVKDS